MGEILQYLSVVGLFFRETQNPNTEWPRGLRWEMGRLIVLSGETAYPVVFAETLHPENSCVSRTRRWEAVVGSNVVNHRVGAGRRGASFYYVCVKTV